jgi:hypothetical protein
MDESRDGDRGRRGWVGEQYPSFVLCASESVDVPANTDEGAEGAVVMATLANVREGSGSSKQGERQRSVWVNEA